MKRSILADLLRWKDSLARMPLLIRGARQVGKTYIVEEFGRSHFDQVVVCNFENRPDFALSFKTLDPKEILAEIELMAGASIVPGKTLLFLDEIQECPKAIMALRYFKEQMPELHVIGAGSLLEFILNDADFRMPVGRVQFLHMRPLSFQEFLEALGEEKLLSALHMAALANPFSDAVHERLLKFVREYVALGGMPAVIATYLKTKSLKTCQDIQNALIFTYRSDFGKYARSSQHKYLQLLYERAPGLVAQWFKYSKVDPNVQVRDIKNALKHLSDAGLLQIVYATNASGLPLVTTINEKKFKILYLDIGLLKRALKLDLKLLFEQDFLLINQGALAEQFVGQELLAYGDPTDSARLFFWVREAVHSAAQVDYVTAIGPRIIPIEVKSGATGKLKSLRIFMDEKKVPFGIRISQAALSFENQILSIPFYLIGEMERLIYEIENQRLK